MSTSEAVAIFGSTGSIGVSTIDVIERNPQRYSIGALSAFKNVELLFEQCVGNQPRYAAMADPAAARELALRLSRTPCETVVLQHEDALEQIASDVLFPVVMAAIVGFAGLTPTLAAARSGKRILLANKESMVVAGDLLTSTAKAGNALIVPVDSEHNAIFQCLPDDGHSSESMHEDVDSLVLTASGGPFREWSLEAMEKATVAQAVNHPNWSMGAKISVDSATMMNKGLEIIEACYLFKIDESRIEVLVHPQSVIHSMVRYRDGSVLAQLGRPDMRTPIAHALSWPNRIDSGVEPLDFKMLSGLHFKEPDLQRFPCLQLAREAMRQGNSANGVLNAANEVAVEQFLQERIRFTDIGAVNAHVLRNYRVDTPGSVEGLRTLDQKVRQFANDYIQNGLTPVEMS